MEAFGEDKLIFNTERVKRNAAEVINWLESWARVNLGGLIGIAT